MLSKTANRLPPGAILIPVATGHMADILALQATLFGADAWSEWMLRSGLRAGHHYRAAIVDGTIIGYAGLAVPAIGPAWVQSIGVHPDHQGQGIGTTLLENLLTRAGERAVGLEVAVDNPARRLYARYGFESTAVRTAYYQPSGKDAVVMLRPAGQERDGLLLAHRAG